MKTLENVLKNEFFETEGLPKKVTYNQKFRQNHQPFLTPLPKNKNLKNNLL